MFGVDPDKRDRSINVPVSHFLEHIGSFFCFFYIFVDFSWKNTGIFHLNRTYLDGWSLILDLD